MYSLDNYFTGTEVSPKPNVTYIKGDTCDIVQLVYFSPDMIYYLDEYSRVEKSYEDMDIVWRYNKDGIFAVFEFARKLGCKILYACSSTKFGDVGFGRNSRPYAWTKSSNTELIINYGQWFNWPYAITYFYNVYGDGEIASGKYATLIALFKKQCALDCP